MIFRSDTDKPKEKCGVFGIYSLQNEKAAELVNQGLYGLQHRGQESAGIASSNGTNIMLEKNIGLVSEVFSEEKLKKLEGNIAVGHVKYSTKGETTAIDAEPLVFHYSRGMVALALNGTFLNAACWRKTLEETGSVFQSFSDLEVIINLMARYSQNTLEEAIIKCMIDVKGSYAIVLMSDNKLIGIRDPNGLRPLCIGKKGQSYALASESCALDTIGAEFLRDVGAGEIVVIDDNGLRSVQGLSASQKGLCSFEYVYLARMDSVIDGQTVSVARQRLGEELAKQKKIDGDIVIPVPDSGKAAAFGYSQESGIPIQEGLVKNPYVGRTFLRPTQKSRDLSVDLKLNPIRTVVDGKKTILVDDSIVRGTTSKKLVDLLKGAGAKKVHIIIGSPPVIYPCWYGVDTSSEDELIAAKFSTEEICQKIGADSLTYIELEGFKAALGTKNLCSACFDGNYPVKLENGKVSSSNRKVR